MRRRCSCRRTSCRTRRRFISSSRTRPPSTGALGRLLAVAEAYPDLKSNQNFLALQSQLEGTENRIAVARRDYILAVQEYNTALRTIPQRWIASILYPDMKVRETFTIPEQSQQVPQVKF